MPERSSLDYDGVTPLLSPEELREAVARIWCGDYQFEVSEHHGLRFLRVFHGEPDASDGAPTTQRGREWPIEGFFTEDELWRTALRAVLDFAEHEMRERFQVDGCPVFHAHPKVEAVLRAVTPQMRTPGFRPS